MAMRASLLILASVAAAFPRLAASQDDPACAKYQEPLAYNACLASHGPKANEIGANRGQSELGQVPYARPSAPAREWPDATRRHGRVHMEFRIQ